VATNVENTQILNVPSSYFWVQDLPKMVKELLLSYYKPTNKTMPKRIILFST